jgi:LmbE family N-acetylglucosaminyl deacetylase
VVVLLAPPPAVRAQTPPKVLLVVAHPDDELVVAATVYRLAQELGGTIDQFVVTNGEGGYRYATLAEKVYGLELTREDVGRRELPDIRKRELLAAGKILGVRAHFFLDEPDVNNTANPNDVLDGAWKTEAVLTRLGDILAREQYGFVVTALPRDTLGGHHLAAALLTLRAVARLDEAERPVVLGAHFTPDVFQVAAADERAGFAGAPDFDFDRTRTFGFNNALDYQIVANWMIAEHKSQGLYQTNMGRSAHEYLWIFNRDVARNRERAQALFAQLAAPAGQ